MPAEYAPPLPETHLNPDASPPSELPHDELGHQQVAERNQWLDQRLNSDPSRPLPEISLAERDSVPIIVSVDGAPAPARTGDPRTATTIYDIMAPSGERAGFAVLKQPKDDPVYHDKYYIGDIKVVDEARHQGYGPATYLAILKSLPLGIGLRTEGVLSADAIGMWDKMVAQGVAHQTGSAERPPTAYETVF